MAVYKEIVERWKVLLGKCKSLIPNDHILVFEGLAESDEDGIIFTKSFILAGPCQDGKRSVIKQLDLKHLYFTSPCPGDKNITWQVEQWLNGHSIENTPPIKNQILTEKDSLWLPSWPTQGFYMPEGASYTQVLP